MESVPEGGVAFFRGDSGGLNQRLTENVELAIVLMDILFTTLSGLATVVHEVV